ncbi:MAG: hypothetical protein QM520_01520, partial [Gammaproteobacteria bacterium]|nr:hypothetical protein [Gammaproteobacteria bacterium]
MVIELLSKTRDYFIQRTKTFCQCYGIKSQIFPSLCQACHIWCYQMMCPYCLELYGKILKRCPLCSLVLSDKVIHKCFQGLVPWQQCYS